MFQVFVIDIWHVPDDDATTPGLKFFTYDDALHWCRTRVDAYLESELKPGMTAQALWDRYTNFGEDYFMQPDREAQTFSGWDYARLRCAEICGGKVPT